MTDSEEPATGMIHFLEEAGNLKHLDRRGWLLRGIPNPERITGHMYRMAVLAMALDPIPDCDMNKVVAMCLLHDLPECRFVYLFQRRLTSNLTYFCVCLTLFLIMNWQGW